MIRALLQDPDYVYILLITVFILGMALGGKIRDSIWAGNADHDQRLDYRGKLYKVKHDGWENR